MPETVHELLDHEPTMATRLRSQQMQGYIAQVAPSFSLRGGTREVLRGIIARGLGLRWSELGSLLADTVTRLFTDLVTKELIESSEKGVWPEKLWRALEEGGLTLPLVPESAGGAGGNWLDAHVVVRAAGRHTAPVPIAETIVASALLAGAGLDVPLGR